MFSRVPLSAQIRLWAYSTAQPHWQYIDDVKGAVTRIINPAVTAGFLPDAYFLTSADHRPIFLTLNDVVKSGSGRLAASAGRLFGHRPIRSGNDQSSGRCPGGVPPTIGRRPSSDCRGACRSPADDNESCGHR